MGERVLSLLLEVGDVIYICHHHDLECCGRLTHWETDAIVTGGPGPVGGRIAVKWAKARLLGARHAITGISLFRPDEKIRRIGHLPVRHPSWAATPTGAGA